MGVNKGCYGKPIDNTWDPYLIYVCVANTFKCRIHLMNNDNNNNSNKQY